MSNISQPDVRLLRSEKLAESPFPATRAADFRIHFHPAAHGRAVAHAKEDKSVEICGVLVGDYGQDADGPYARITEIIRCDSATKKFAEVTFTHESWTQINREMDTKFANLRIVGWYHSHPDFGIFLSDRDVFIQENFFSGPGQLAFVVDPVRDAEGVFEWHDGKPVLSSHYWIGGRISGGEATARGGGQVGGPEAARGPGSSSSAPMPGPSLPIERGGSRGGTVMTLAFCLMFFLVGYLLSGRRASPWEDARLIEGVAAHLRQWKGSESQHRLEDLQRLVALLSLEIGKLSEDHVKLAGDKSKDLAKEWAVVRQAVGECRALLAQLEERYAISPEDGSILREEIRGMARRIADDEAAHAELRKSAKSASDDQPAASKGAETEPPQNPQKTKPDDPPKKSTEKSREP
jgi:proteasome lid subunit RPN8/RPN11